MASNDFLLEVRTEEIPASALAPARADLLRKATEALAEEGLAPVEGQALATPRRLILWLRGVPERQEDRASEVLGPPAAAAYDSAGKPTRAAEGFARAQKVDVGDLVLVDSPRGRTVAARRTVAGRPAGDVLGEVIPRVVASLSFPKTMRWGSGEYAFVRPVRGLLALFAGQLVPMSIDGVTSGNRTVGHRILANEEFTVNGHDDYFRRLRSSHVEPDGEVRRMAILQAARGLAGEVGGSIEPDLDLAAVLADLVEFPGIVRGAYSAEFLDLPEEITTTAMRVHQKYLPVRGPRGLLPY
ncbi:MAG TPA: glycine--tRNA ligase subunit beta, partial [Thermoanaerobaculia bacterium]|nr:glycine--tRNA ligase subunit beta [Thermoanaerobaculia bacterium]